MIEPAAVGACSSADLIAAEFVTTIDFRPRDYDLNGHLSHLAYLELAEIARQRHMRAAGIPPEYLVTQQCGLVILELRVRYLNEVREGVESLDVTTSITPLGRKTVLYRQIGREGDRAVCELDITMGLLDLLMRKLRPDPIGELQQLIDRRASQDPIDTSEPQTRSTSGQQ